MNAPAGNLMIEISSIKQLVCEMNWFYTINGQKKGPVSDSQLDELLSSGKIIQDTPVCREGATDWQPLNMARAGGPPPVLNFKSTVCVECGRAFSAEDLIQLNRSWVCARCKPVFLQKMSEGAAPSGSAGSMWRMKKQLVTHSETPFPDRCVKCNAPANGFRLKRVLYWQHPAYYLLLLINLLILVIVVLIVRKKAILNIGLCNIHRAKRQQAIIIGWSGTLGGLALACIGGIAFKSGWLVLVGIIVFLVAAIYGGVVGPIISAAKVTKENVWVKGVHRDFLAGLPEWPGS
jgi:GYF domain 2